MGTAITEKGGAKKQKRMRSPSPPPFLPLSPPSFFLSPIPFSPISIPPLSSSSSSLLLLFPFLSTSSSLYLNFLPQPVG